MNNYVLKISIFYNELRSLGKKIKIHIYAFKVLLNEFIFVKREDFYASKIKILIFYSEADLNYRKSGVFIADKIDPIFSEEYTQTWNIIRVIKPPSKIVNNNIRTFNKFYFISLIKVIAKDFNFLRKSHQIFFKCYQDILSRVKPQFVISTDSDPYIIAACKSKNIKYIDFQHGLIDVSMESIKEAIKQEIIFLVWDEFHKNKLIHNGAKNVITIGIPSLNPVILRNQDLNVVNSDQKEILILLTWKLPKSIDRYGVISKNTFLMFKEIQSEFPEIKFRVRPHPVSVDLYGYKRIKRLILKEFKKPDLSVENPWETPILQSLNRTKYIIGYPSATVIEAAAKGIQSFVDYSEDFMNCIDLNLIERGYLKVFKDIDESFSSAISCQHSNSLSPYTDNLQDKKSLNDILNSIFNTYK